MTDTHSFRELTFRVLVISILLTVLLAISNAYLALKIGILTSASIPAAVISMGILRFFKNPSIFENNLVQTAASAGEAVAGGIVYTAPALIIIHYWHQFSYFQNFMLAFIGGVLGVLFSIPIRKALVSDKALPFPEGKAIAEVLKVQQQKKIGLHFLFWGGAIGALLELFQTGLKIIAGSWQAWLMKGRLIIGFGAGFSATMIGAGYLIGFTTGISILIGALLGWFLAVPAISYFYHLTPVADMPLQQFVSQIWWQKISYIGISAMLFAGVITLCNLIKPLIQSFKFSKLLSKQPASYIPRYEKDMPAILVIPLILLMFVIAGWFLKNNLPIEALGFKQYLPSFLLACLLYLLIVGFIFSAITGYFSGLVGVTASPGSAIVIAGLLIAALILNLVMHLMQLQQKNVLEAEAIVIFLVAILTGIAAIANDNIQDLKVGHLIQATPWKQQLMLLIGVVISASVIPPIMQILFNTYGIADVMPHEGMDPAQTLPAPPAALMATIVKGVFNAQLPWPMIAIGAVIVFISLMINLVLQKKFNKRISILGIAIGIYLPLASSIPIFIGSLIEYYLRRHKIVSFEKRHVGMLIACGLIAGSVLMDVVLAIPFSIAGNPDALKIMPIEFTSIAVIFGFISTIILGIWFFKTVANFEQKS